MLKVDPADDGQLKGSGNEILYDDVFSDAARVREAAGPAHKSEVSRADTGRDIHYTVFNDQVELVTICVLRKRFILMFSFVVVNPEFTFHMGQEQFEKPVLACYVLDWLKPLTYPSFIGVRSASPPLPRHACLGHVQHWRMYLANTDF